MHGGGGGRANDLEEGGSAGEAVGGEGPATGGALRGTQAAHGRVEVVVGGDIGAGGDAGEGSRLHGEVGRGAGTAGGAACRRAPIAEGVTGSALIEGGGEELRRAGGTARQPRGGAGGATSGAGETRAGGGVLVVAVGTRGLTD